MMEYLTYEEYTNLGGVLDLTAFSRNITKVCGIIENATQGRIQTLYGIPKEVKMLCCDLVEYFANNFGSSKQISNHNESAGGVSISESYVIRSTEERAGEIDDMIYDYLGQVRTKDGTPILYRGAKF